MPRDHMFFPSRREILMFLSVDLSMAESFLPRYQVAALVRVSEKRKKQNVGDSEAA